MRNWGIGITVVVIIIIAAWFAIDGVDILDDSEPVAPTETEEPVEETQD